MLNSVSMIFLLYFEYNITHFTRKYNRVEYRNYDLKTTFRDINKGFNLKRLNCMLLRTQIYDKGNCLGILRNEYEKYDMLFYFMTCALSSGFLCVCVCVDMYVECVCFHF